MENDGNLKIGLKNSDLGAIYAVIPSLNLIFPRPNHENEANDSSKEVYKQFCSLSKRKTDLKLEFVSEKLFQKLLTVRETLVGIMNDQKRAISKETVLTVSDLTSTYLEYVPHLCCESKQLLISWIQVKVSILSNQWCRTNLGNKLKKYELKSKTFFTVSTDVATYLKSVIESGLVLLCKLSGDKVHKKFCDDFVGGLKEYNIFIEILNSYMNSEKFNKILLIDVMTKMAFICGVQLAETLSNKIAKHCNTIEKLENYKSNNPTTAASLISNECCQNKRTTSTDSKPSETSDYFSSSASSSSKTFDDAQVFAGTNKKKQQLPRIPFAVLPKFSKKLQNFYAHYLEQKFIVFNLFAQEESNSSDEHNGRKSMWKTYLSITWDKFSNELQTISTLGLYKIPSLVQLDERFRLQLIDFITDSILVGKQ